MRKQHYLGVLVFGAFAVLLAVVFLRQPAGPAVAEGITQISTGAQHTCALMATDDVRCWGNNEWGELGSGVPVPPPPATPPLPTPTPFTSTLPIHVCEDSDCNFALDDVTEIAAGGDASARGHTCALTASGNVWCWGMNDIGQLGNGEGGSADDYSAAPVEVCKVYGTSSCTTPLDNIVSVAGVNNHTCAVDTVSRVYCWGQNEQEQLGNPEIDEVCQTRSGPSILDYDCSRVAFPVCVAATGDTCDIELDGVTVVAPGGTHTCAYIAADSQAKCWGDNVWSALGAGLAGGPGAAEYDFAIDVCVSGSWDDGAGECQDAEGFPSPLTNVKGIASGAYHSCALVDAPPAGTNYEVKCWGWNACGQLGNNEEEDGINYCGIFRHSKDQNRPVSVCEDWGMSSCTTELDNVEALAAGLGHTCALMNGGTVKCWGWNKYGQLGDGHDGDTGHDLADTVVCVAGKAGTCVALDGVARIAAALGHSCAVQDDNRAQCWGDNRSQQLGYDTGIETYSEHAAPVTGITIIAAGTPDYDGDGCSDSQENQTSGASHYSGGLRNPKYFWDFYDVWTHPLNQPLAWERNKVINNADRFGVLGRFGPGPTPVSEEASRAAALETPVSGSGYHAAFDRGPKIGPNAWDRAPADGTINIADDIIGISAQFGHDCS